VSLLQSMRPIPDSPIASLPAWWRLPAQPPIAWARYPFQLGLEGVIGKKAESPYRAGRTTNWVRMKTAHGRHIDEERAKWNE
jgi:hypothetical protein